MPIKPTLNKDATSKPRMKQGIGKHDSGIRTIVQGYLEQGYVPVPIEPGKRYCTELGWNQTRHETINLDALFPTGFAGGVAILNGEPSGGLIDIDLDCPEARQAASILLPPTERIWGRKSAPDSHYGYRVDDPPMTAHDDFNGPSGEHLCEIRSTGGMSTVPPTIVLGKSDRGTTDEPCVWNHNGDPAHMDYQELKRAVSKVAAAALIAKYWPTGNRHNASLALTGGLLRAKWSEPDITMFVEAICKAADDEEPDGRCKNVETTAERFENDDNVTGWPKLKELIGDAVVDRICQWLDIKAKVKILLPDESLSFRPFPTDALPEMIRNYVEVGAVGILCDPSFIALPLLTACGAAIGNTRRLRIKTGWDAPPIIWTMLVCESGTAKSPAFAAAMKAVDDRQFRLLKEHEKDMEDYKQEVRDCRKSDDEPPEAPKAQRCKVTDTSVEAIFPILKANPRGLLLSDDELAGFFESMNKYTKGGGDSPAYLKMYGGFSHTIDRKGGDNPTITVPRASVCITGGIQPGVIQKIITGHMDSGMAARFLMCFPPRKVKRWNEEGIDEVLEQRLADLFERLFSLEFDKNKPDNNDPIIVEFTEDAKDRWIKYFNDHADEQVTHTNELAAAWSKLEETPLRLALILHYIRWAESGTPLADYDDHVDLDSMNAALTLVEWFKHEALRVYAMFKETGAESNVRRLIEWIKNKGGIVTARDVYTGCRWIKDSTTANAILAELVEAGRGYWQEPESGERGKPVRYFHLSAPSALSASALIENPPNKKPRNNADADSADGADGDDKAKVQKQTIARS